MSTAPIALSAHAAAALRQRHAHVFHRPLGKRLLAPLMLLGTLAYLVFCFFFFNVPAVLDNAQWDRAGTYVADWYSWEATPRFRFKDGSVELEWTRSLLGPNPDPDWIVKTGPDSYTTSFGSPDNSVEISPTAVVAVIDGVRYPVPVTADGAVLPANAPASMSLKGGRVTVDYGFAGLAEVRNTQVYVRHRFFGWANFFFDPSSDFFGMDAGQLWQAALSPDRLDPARPNWQAMALDFLYNSEWQHLDVLDKLLQTIVMAFVGTLFAAVVAFPLAFLAARNITPNPLGNWLMKRVFDFLRSVDMLIWALFFVRGFGPGPIPGIAAIFFTDTGTLGKTSTEALENVDDRQREGVRSVGASPMAVHRYGVVPQVAPVFISQVLYFWESNTRSATIIGAVGAGGIGLKLIEAMRTNQDWENVAYMVILILIVVFLFDNLSNAIRSRLIGTTRH
ncbi:phosphonate ABC transporter, permease protein PhnE [Devosia aquimaris]|uniref:phosphonate ABC transporter, permease protein PhnE n=1 Tax=Devosia aquimaris TaxID=2866214 RepID=UPI001CD07A05|nr:phosphonate ABC transporter, permease protein PhnE [Devosia sp. CJK-A8-3]